jgi:hypothetical protein
MRAGQGHSPIHYGLVAEVGQTRQLEGLVSACGGVGSSPTETSRDLGYPAFSLSETEKEATC